MKRILLIIIAIFSLCSCSLNLYNNDKDIKYINDILNDYNSDESLSLKNYLANELNTGIILNDNTYSFLIKREDEELTRATLSFKQK